MRKMHSLSFVERALSKAKHLSLSAISSSYRQLARIDGLMTARELWALERAASQLKTGATCVEIGAYKGKSTYMLQRAFRRKGIRHIVVDTFCTGVGGEDDGEFLDEFKGNLSPYLSNLTIWRMDSEGLEARLRSEGIRVDFAFIDGDHSYRGARNDCDAVVGNAKRGAVICFHDFLHPCGVTRAVGEFVESRSIRPTRAVDSLLIAEVVVEVETPSGELS